MIFNGFALCLWGQPRYGKGKIPAKWQQPPGQTNRWNRQQGAAEVAVNEEQPWVLTRDRRHAKLTLGNRRSFTVKNLLDYYNRFCGCCTVQVNRITISTIGPKIVFELSDVTLGSKEYVHIPLAKDHLSGSIQPLLSGNFLKFSSLLARSMSQVGSEIKKDQEYPFCKIKGNFPSSGLRVAFLPHSRGLQECFVSLSHILTHSSSKLVGVSIQTAPFRVGTMVYLVSIHIARIGRDMKSKGVRTTRNWTALRDSLPLEWTGFAEIGGWRRFGLDPWGRWRCNCRRARGKLRLEAEIHRNFSFIWFPFLRWLDMIYS